MRRLLAITIALWSGSLCTICAIAAPTLFATLDRSAAGQAVAALFRIEAWLGLAFAAIAAFALRAFPGERRAKVLVAATAAAPLLSELVVGPMMSSARSANDMTRFGMLHGVAAALFFAACACSLALLWKVSRPAG
jgi:Domain of unknown function (DUF4149)